MIGLKFLNAMSTFKKLKAPKRILDISVPPVDFKSIWIQALKNKNSDLTELLKILDPFLQQVSYNILNDKYDYYLVSILNLVNLNSKISIHKKNLWIKSIHSDVYQEIVLLLVKRCRRLTKIPYNASPEMCEHYFLTDLKYAISKQISKIRKLDLSKVPNNFQKQKICIKIEDLWYNYLYQLYKYGYTKKEISEITNLSRQTIYIEEKKLCQYLKKKLLKT